MNDNINKPKLENEFKNFIYDVANEAGNAIKAIIADIKTSAYTPLGLVDFVKTHDPIVDKFIQHKLKTTKLKYIGGEFKIYYIDESYFGINISLYFQNEQNKYIKTKYEYKTHNRRKLTTEAFDELRKEKTIVFEIDEPVINDEVNATDKQI